MENKINLNVLCVLTRKQLVADLELDYVPVKNYFVNALESLSEICDDGVPRTDRLINFINNSEEFNELEGHYRYCEDIKSPYQGFTFSKAAILKSIETQISLIVTNKGNNPGYDADGATRALKKDIKSQYILACHAYSIGKTYRQCHDDTDILTFSHRICGWSNPVYQLATDFSVELKTNFGYGHASYFYTILKYKDIEISPLSEWINYEFAQFSEIIRYSRKFPLEHEEWLNALNFSKDACNLALKDETKFVSEYIVQECESMVGGLEDLFLKDKFIFHSQDNKRYTVDKRGHVLIEFRGEKISGAIDFISKILELKKIAAIQTFIERIRACNKKIQPILASEAVILGQKIQEVKKEIEALQPEFDRVNRELTDYAYKQEKLKRELINAGKMSWKEIDTELIFKEFNLRFPEYEAFLTLFKKVKENYVKTTEHLQNLEGIWHRIDFFNTRIIDYFKAHP